MRTSPTAATHSLPEPRPLPGSSVGLPGGDRWSSSAIRDLLAQSRAPGMISLAGGLPADASLPTEEIRDRVMRVLDHHHHRTLQYGVTAGEPELREHLASLEAVHPDDLVVTAGSQQALDLLARVLMVPGDVVVVEAPGYVGALQVMRAAELDIRGCPVDQDGIDTSSLEQMLDRGLRPRAVYVNPHHQNPSGASLTVERQRHLLELADRHRFWIMADDPYREITFDRPPPLPDHGLHPKTGHRVVLLGSLSKTLSPGLRIGWCSGPQPVMERIERAKQAADLHTASLNQLLAASMLSDHRWWLGHLRALRIDYQDRRNRLARAIERHLPDAVVASPSGGFFMWIDLPGSDTTALLDRALQAGVAFVPGAAFSADQRPTSTLRLSYSHAAPDTFDDAVRRLAAAVAVEGG